jgi:hypothetical protein
MMRVNMSDKIKKMNSIFGTSKKGIKIPTPSLWVQNKDCNTQH